MKTSAQLDAEIKATLNGAKHGILARRKTADDKIVLLHADGTLTWGLGTAIKGSANARTPAAIEEALDAGWIVMGEVELCEADEVPRLIEIARKAARLGGEAKLPGNVRAAFHKKAPLKPHWTTLEADRNGKPIVRVWRLPRISHPGMAIWDTARNASRGRYEVMVAVRHRGILGQRSDGDTYTTTGVRFHDLDKLSQYLRETSSL